MNARGWVHHESRWLINYDQIFVFMDDIERNVLRFKDLRWRSDEFDFYFITLSQSVRSLRTSAVHDNVFVFD
jgi:hypothetical protein